MRRIISLFLALIIVLSIAGCGASQGSKNGSNQSASSEIKEDDALRIPIPDVSKKTLPEAIKELEESGFTSISSPTNDPDWSPDRWVVISQNFPAGDRVLPSDNIILTCAKLCQLYIDVTSEANLIFNKYDIELYFEDTEIGTVANGKGFTKLLSVLEGKYKFIAYKSGDHSVSTSKSITVSSDMTFQCDIEHGNSTIGFINIKTQESIEGASLVMVDTTGMVLSEAMNQLSTIGFSNVREEPYNDIWNKDNWIVVSQSVNAGETIDKNTSIKLECISLDEYFNKTFTGKNAAEVLSLAADAGFSVKFKDSSGTDQTDRITNAADDEKTDWVVTKASQYSGRTASVVVEYTGETPVLTATSTPKPTEEPVPDEETVDNNDHTETTKNYVDYHSSHDFEIAKKGNSGVFAYKTLGASYDIYLVIDLDEGYVYRFLTNEDTCERAKISYGDSGDGLGQVIVVTYHDGNDVWQEGFHFKWNRNPDHLINEDYYGFETDFYTTDLDSALKLREKKHIVNY